MRPAIEATIGIAVRTATTLGLHNGIEIVHPAIEARLLIAESFIQDDPGDSGGRANALYAAAMRGLLLPGLMLAVGLFFTVALIIWLRSRTAGGLGPALGIPQIRTVHGAARCLAITRLLTDLGRRGDSTRIASAWNDLEMPLLEALPDCPPDAKTALIDALDACAKACRVVACRHGIMNLRNSLL